jgi:hypothetical protein
MPWVFQSQPLTDDVQIQPKNSTDRKQKITSVNKHESGRQRFILKKQYSIEYDF